MRERGHERGDIADAGAERGGQQLACGGGLRQGLLGDDLARGAEDALAEHHTKRTENDDLRIERVDEEREAAAHPLACDSGDGESVGVVAEHGFNERADGGLSGPASGEHFGGDFDEACAGGEGFPGATLAKARRAVFGEAPVANFAGSVGSATEDAAVDDEAAADAGAKGEEDKVLEIGASFADAVMKLGEGAGVAIVLDEDGQAGKGAGEFGLERDGVPAGQVRRIDKEAFFDAEGAADGDAEAADGAALASGLRDECAGVREERGEGLREGLGGAGFKFAALEDAGVGCAFDAGGLGAADVEAEEGGLRG